MKTIAKLHLTTGETYAVERDQFVQLGASIARSVWRRVEEHDPLVVVLLDDRGEISGARFAIAFNPSVIRAVEPWQGEV